MIDSIFIDFNYKFESFVSKLLGILNSIGSVNKLCFAIPGTVDIYRKFVINCPNLKYWKNLDFSKLEYEVRSKGIKLNTILVSNDANAGCIGAYKISRLNNNNVVYLAIGTGIGGGAIINNKLLVGANFSAMEIGHTKIDRRSYICGCGDWGCIETFCSSRALTNYYNQKKSTKYMNLLSIINEEPKRLVKGLFNRFSRFLSILIANIIYMIDPDYIFISGKIVLSSSIFENQLYKFIKSRTSMIRNYDLSRIVFLKDIEKCNTYNLVGSVYIDEFV